MTSFKPMLACSKPILAADATFPVYAQPKFDGIRCTVLPELGPVSRTLKPIPNDFIRAALDTTTALHHDGEIVTYTDGRPDELNTVQSKVMAKDGEPDFVYHTFDHVAVPEDPYEKRFARIAFGSKSPLYKMTTLADLDRYENEMVVAGWEGVILRKPGSPYKFGRSTMREGTLLKMKRFHDSEAAVVGFVELTTNTNEQTRDELGHAKRSKAKSGMVPAGTLGALKMRWDNGRELVEFELGGGFTEKQRQEIWDAQDDHMGKPVTFKFQRIGPKGAPLLPVFKAFRAEFDFG